MTVLKDGVNEVEYVDLQYDDEVDRRVAHSRTASLVRNSQ